MKKFIYAILFVFTCSMLCPVATVASQGIEIIDADQIVVSVVSGSTVHVQNANGLTMYVYDVAGVVQKTIVIDGPDRNYDLNLNKGCYIIKVGKVVRKISIK